MKQKTFDYLDVEVGEDTVELPLFNLLFINGLLMTEGLDYNIEKKTRRVYTVRFLGDGDTNDGFTVASEDSISIVR